MASKVASFSDAIDGTERALVTMGHLVDPGHWQGVTTEGKPDLQTVELLDVQWQCPVPEYVGQLQEEIQPNLPWADDHFEERVSRVPSNPGEQYMNWPWWRGQDDTSRTEPGLKFTHTYQERYWPTYAGTDEHGRPKGNRGIRYAYGDLDDVVKLLLRAPYTRQAWLPIFFPEDTGAVHGGRVPCTLGYQFMLRDNKLHLWYVIRSCDYVRHFRDDLYLSARLLLWMLDQLQGREQIYNERNPELEDSDWVWADVRPGEFHFHCFSLHYHRGDEHLLRKGGER